jgi:hypothetical protein
MSEPAVLPVDTQEQQSHARLMAGIAAVSFSSLLLELGLTRLFSVTLFYHFAFLAISIALLGLGAGGVFAFIRRRWLERWTVRQLGAALCLANAAAIVAVLEIVLHVPISLELTWANFGKLTIIYLCSGVPFFFTGVLMSVVFAREHGLISRLYGADLMGGATACLAIVPLLDWMGGPNAIVFAALAMAAAAAVWAETARWRRFVGLALLLLALLIGLNWRGRLIDIVYAKGMRRDQPWMEYARWNAISRVEVDDQGGAKAIVIDADASTYIMNQDPAKPPAWDLMAAPSATVNALRPHGTYAIIGPGGGVDVLRAVMSGSPSVTGIEINPIIVNDIMRGRYAAYSQHLYELPQVHIHVSDGRSWVRSTNEKFDVIQMTLVDTWASTAAGAFALSENNLYTVEAFKEYFQHLEPDGIIAITRWEFKEPREALRVVSQEVEALRELGVKDPADHFIVVADGALDSDGRPVTVLAKKTPFTLAESSLVAHQIVGHPNLFSLYLAHFANGFPLDVPPDAAKELPGCGAFIAEQKSKFGSKLSDQELQYECEADALQIVRPVRASARLPFYNLITARSQSPGVIPLHLPGQPAGDPLSDFIRAYPYDISPVHDNAPFFFFTIKTGDAIRHVLSGSGRGIDWKVNLGVVVLGIVLLLSMVAVAAFLVLPLLLHGARAGSAGRLVYFIAIGLAYIMVEIVFIQRFVLFLGHPTYALTVVVFLMLLSSGAGSLVARSWLKDPRRVRRVMAAVVAILVALVWALPHVLETLVGLPFTAKLGISAAILAPLGFLMGMPFPTGLRALADSGEETIEWAWAMNAAASVMGSVLAMVLAIHFGLNFTLACGAIGYALAMALTAGWRRANA